MGGRGRRGGENSNPLRHELGSGVLEMRCDAHSLTKRTHHRCTKLAWSIRNQDRVRRWCAVWGGEEGGGGGGTYTLSSLRTLPTSTSSQLSYPPPLRRVPYLPKRRVHTNPAQPVIPQTILPSLAYTISIQHSPRDPSIVTANYIIIPDPPQSLYPPTRAHVVTCTHHTTPHNSTCS